MTGTLGFAILGAGVAAEYHQQAINANADLGAELVAIGHYDPARFGAISDQFGVPCVPVVDILANPVVDVVCLCTPSGQHAAQTVDLARAGKHVLVEKPMALNTADADTMIAACESAGVKLGVVFQRRANLLYRRIHEAIEAGDLGDLAMGVITMPYFRSQDYYNQADWRGTWAWDGGVLMNQGIHQIDLLVWFMGDPVDVRAHAGTLYRSMEVEDTVAATLMFEGGALATIIATTTAGDGFPHRIEVYGTNGGIRTEGDMLTDWRVSNLVKATVEVPKRIVASGGGAGADPRGITADDHSALFRDFIYAIHEDRPPCVSGQEGRRSVAVVNAIYRAAGLIV